MHRSQKAVRVGVPLLREVTSEIAIADRREMAIPSYTHWNPLVRRLFWRRLDVALAVANVRSGERVFEFGVGSGVLLPSHHRAGAVVTATDRELHPARRLAARLSLPTSLVELAEFSAWSLRHVGDIDCIFAIDVLEHLDDAELGEVLRSFEAVTSVDGRLVVCGPTESVMYRLGRRLAGFRNEYHHRTIFDIDHRVRERWTRTSWMALPARPLPRAFYVGRYELRG